MAQPLSNLPIEALVKDLETTYNGVPIIWKIADKNHTGYPADSVTLITEKIISMKPFDATESGGDSNRQSSGNNRYSLSNMRQWLNKSGANWFTAQHTYDRAPSSSYVWANTNPYSTEAGFLTGFSAQFIAALMDTTLTVALPTVDGGGSETVTDKFFLASKQEVGLGAENSIAEGALLALFNSSASSRLCTCTAQAIANSNYTSNPTTAANWRWWLRSPSSSSSGSVRSVGADGSETGYGAYFGTVGLRPLCNLPSDLPVSDTVDADGAYILWDVAPKINVKHEGAWKQATPYVKSQGVWKPVKSVFAKQNGAWKQSV